MGKKMPQPVPPKAGAPGYAKGTDNAARKAAKPGTMGMAHGPKGNEGTHYCG